ncbi:uncharacterized protein [Clytia hemisphaerica]|eukprot:TCONS_00059549-protein
MFSFTMFLVIFLAIIQIASSNNAMKQLAEKYAPLIRMAKGDPWRPSSVEFFLKHTKLTGNINQAHVTTSNLPKCPQRGCYLTTKQNMNKDTTSNLPVFYGEPLDKAPIYAFHETTPTEIIIDYYTFYPYNRGKTICIGIAGSGKCEKRVWGVCIFYSPKCAGYAKSFGHHVGDWEGIKIVFHANRSPKYIQFRAHGTKYTFNYQNGNFIRNGESIRFHGNHPIVYSAWGSHGARITAGSHVYQTIPVNNKLTDVTSDGPAWHTWRNVVLIQKKKVGEYTGNESWVNFRGRWGNKKRSCDFWERISNECVQNSGPGGPY